MEKRIAGFTVIDEPELGTRCVDCADAHQIDPEGYTADKGQWVDGYGNGLRPVYYRRREVGTAVGTTIIYSRPDFECMGCGN